MYEEQLSDTATPSQMHPRNLLSVHDRLLNMMSLFINSHPSSRWWVKQFFKVSSGIMADKFDLKGTHEPPSLTLLPILIAEDVELNIGEPNFVSGNSS